MFSQVLILLRGSKGLTVLLLIRSFGDRIKNKFSTVRFMVPGRSRVILVDNIDNCSDRKRLIYADGLFVDF